MNSITEIAEIAHETNRTYCQTIGDYSQVGWDFCEQWQRLSALDGVRAIERGIVTKPEQSHENWLEHKVEEGWEHGSVKNEKIKEHPCMLPFNELSEEQQMKDHLFFTIVTTLLGR